MPNSPDDPPGYSSSTHSAYSTLSPLHPQVNWASVSVSICAQVCIGTCIDVQWQVVILLHALRRIMKALIQFCFSSAFLFTLESPYQSHSMCQQEIGLYNNRVWNCFILAIKTLAGCSLHIPNKRIQKVHDSLTCAQYLRQRMCGFVENLCDSIMIYYYW